MKFEINIKKIKEVISLIDKIANKQQTLPVLSCIVLDVNKNTLVFRSTNLDIGVEISIPIKSFSDGVVAIPAHTLSLFISQINDQDKPVSFEVVSGNVQITTNKTKGLIKTINHEDFPTIPKITNEEVFELPTNLFIKGLQSVWYSASISTIKPELSSVFVYKDSNNISFVATDSFRLAEKKMILEKQIKIKDTLIPHRNIQDIIRIISSVGPSIKISSNKNLISFEGDGVYLVSRVVDGVFPDYRQIIPKSFLTEVVLLKHDILNALKIANIFSDKFNQIHLSVNTKTKTLEVSNKNIDVGENKTAIEANTSGESVEMNFNQKYISDGLQSIDSESISLQISGPNKPMIIRPVSGEQNFMYLVMPMNR